MKYFFEVTLRSCPLRLAIVADLVNEEVLLKRFKGLSFGVRKISECAVDFNFTVSDCPDSVARTDRKFRVGPCVGFKKDGHTVQIGLKRRSIVSDGRYGILISLALRSAEFYGEQRWEALIQVLESWVGLEFEASSGVRLHSLTFVDFDRKTVALIAPSGFGKSTLASSFSDAVVCDEVLFLKDRVIEPQPIHLRLKEAPHTDEEALTTVHGLRRIVTIPQKYSALTLDRLALGQVEICSRPLAAFKIFCAVLLGLGLQQNPEFTFGASTALKWLRVLKSRIHFLITHAAAGRIEWSPLSRAAVRVRLRGQSPSEF